MTTVTRRVFTLLATLAIHSTVAQAQPPKEMVQPVDVYLRSARIAIATNPPEWVRAQRNLELAREHYPENFEVHLLLGTVWAEKDEVDSMVTEFSLARKHASDAEWGKKARDLDKVIDSKWLDRFNRGVNLLGQSDSIADIAAESGDAAKSDSLNGVVAQIRAMAAEALRHCTVLKPSDFRAYATRGIVYQRMGDNTTGMGDFLKAESLFHRLEFMDSTTNWYDTTSFFGGAGEKTEAFKQFETKYKKLNEEKRTRYNNLLRSLAAGYYDAEDCPKTIVVNRRYLGLFPKDINAIVTLADCFSRLGMEADAYKWQEITVTEDPNNKDTWYNLGIFFYNNAVRLQDSIATYSKALDRDRNDSAARKSRLNFVEQSLESFARAIPRFRKVVELDEKDHETWRLLAICYYSVASLAVDEQLAEDKAHHDDALRRIWQIFTGADAPFDQHDAWMNAKEILRKTTDLFPDDSAICKMLKVTYAQLNDVENLRAINAKCQ